MQIRLVEGVLLVELIYIHVFLVLVVVKDMGLCLVLVVLPDPRDSTQIWLLLHLVVHKYFCYLFANPGSTR